jgi:transposase
MPVYIGVDFHARQQTISYLTTKDGEIKGLQLDHGQPAAVREFYEQFGDELVIVGYESSGYAAWFEEMLEELGHEIWVGDAKAIRSYANPSLFTGKPGRITTTAIPTAAGEDADDDHQQSGVHGGEPRSDLTAAV